MGPETFSEIRISITAEIEELRKAAYEPDQDPRKAIELLSQAQGLVKTLEICAKHIKD